MYADDDIDITELQTIDDYLRDELCKIEEKLYKNRFRLDIKYLLRPPEIKRQKKRWTNIGILIDSIINTKHTIDYRMVELLYINEEIKRNWFTVMLRDIWNTMFRPASILGIKLCD